MSVVIKNSGDGFPMLVHKNRGSSVLMEITGKTGAKAKVDPKTSHVSSNPTPEEEEDKSNDWIPWGSDDDFPRAITKLIRKSTVGRAGLQRLTKYIYGQRLITYKIKDIEESGKEVIEMVRIPEWEAIKRRSNFNALRLINAQDYSYFALAYVELIFTTDKSKVHSIHVHKASHCRLGRRDKKTGRITKVYISGMFPEAKNSDCQIIDVIDMLDYHSQIEEIREDKTKHKYIMPIFWPDVMNDYYPVVFWDSARESGWLDIATSIPAYKKALFNNQMSLKYHIKVPVSYFTTRYKDWSKMTQENRDKVVEDLYDEVNDMLTGAENAQKAIITFTETNKVSGREEGAWTIDVIDDKMKQGQWLPDASAANSEILFSMGMNPAISGQGNTGGSHSGGANNGGSNIRESGLDLRSQLKSDRDILLSFFDFIKEYNQIDEEVEIGIQDMVLTTLDQGRGTQKVVS